MLADGPQTSSRADTPRETHVYQGDVAALKSSTSRSKPLPPFSSFFVNEPAPTYSFHARAKPVGFLTSSLTRLIGSFHCL